MDLIENAAGVRVVSFGGADLTDQLTMTGEIPDIDVTASMIVATQVARVELLSPRSGNWCTVNVGSHERDHLRRGGTIRINARVVYRD